MYVNVCTLKLMLDLYATRDLFSRGYMRCHNLYQHSCGTMLRYKKLNKRYANMLDIATEAH